MLCCDGREQEFLHAYHAYERHAFGYDELRPVSQAHHTAFGSGMGLTLIDALDTLIIMKCTDEYERARQWVADHLRFTDQEDINTFETTIRVLGGLLSAFALTQDALYRQKAVELADAMIHAFDSPTGLPFGTIGLRSKRKYNPDWCGGASTIAEVGSVQLEWQYLSRIAHDPIYADKVNAVNGMRRSHLMGRLQL